MHKQPYKPRTPNGLSNWYLYPYLEKEKRNIIAIQSGISIRQGRMPHPRPLPLGERKRRSWGRGRGTDRGGEAWTEAARRDAWWVFFFTLTERAGGLSRQLTGRGQMDGYSTNPRG
jgi:hypothetical protein